MTMNVAQTAGTHAASTVASPCLSIAIVGAGIGGLSLATTLLSKGCRDVRVFERSKVLSSRGGTVRIEEIAQGALAKMGVWQQVEELAIRMQGFESYSNGRLLNRYTPNLISISREGLQKILADSVPPEVLHLGHCVVGVNKSDKVELSFADGTTQAFDLVVGADGINSVVAAQCFAKQQAAAEFTGCVVYYCLAKGAFVPEPVYTEHFISRGGLSFRMVTVSGGGTDGRLDSLQITTRSAACSSEWAAQGTAEEMMWYLDIAGDKCLRGAREILTNADRVFKWGMYQSPQMPTWIAADGGAVLLGDAAHAMAPFTGQGASSAIRDGLCLGELLATRPASVAVEEFEKARKKICQDAIKGAYTRGVRITSHGISRWYTDLTTRLVLWCSKHQVLRHVVRMPTFTVDTGADVLELVDKVIDVFRFDNKGPDSTSTD